MRKQRRESPLQLALALEEPAPIERGITLTVGGVTLPVMQWAVQLGVSTQTIYARIDNGWSPEACVARWVPQPAARKSRSPAGHPDALSWDTQEWADDDRAWYVVAHHPDGLEVHQVAELQGISTSQVNKILQRVREKAQLIYELHERVDRESMDIIERHLRGQPIEAFRAAAARDTKTLCAWAESLRG